MNFASVMKPVSSAVSKSSKAAKIKSIKVKVKFKDKDKAADVKD